MLFGFVFVLSNTLSDTRTVDEGPVPREFPFVSNLKYE